MKRQEGQAFILVLILLAVGALMIVPGLNLTFTGLKSQRISENALTRVEVADAAVENALWQMLNDMVGGGSPATGTFTFELGNFSITVPTIPNSRNQGSGNIRNLFFIVDPQWLAPGDAAVKSYIIAVDTQKWESLTSMGFTLPKGMTYSAGSTYYRAPTGVASGTLDLTPDGMYWNWKNQVDLVGHRVKMQTTWQAMTGGGYVEVYDGIYPPNHPQAGVSYLYITNQADGRQKLEWKPYFAGLSGRRIFIETLHVVGNPVWGIHYITGWFYGTENIDTEKTAALGAALYTLVIPVGGISYEVVVAYDSTINPATGLPYGFKIISYQVVQ